MRGFPLPFSGRVGTPMEKFTFHAAQPVLSYYVQEKADDGGAFRPPKQP